MLRELGFTSAPCVIVEADDTEARLLSQALNRIQGEDDLGLRSELMQQVLRDLPQEEVLKLLAETVQSLQALATLGREDLAEYLRSYQQQTQGARLKHLTFQFTTEQVAVVEEALARVLAQVKGHCSGNPNCRGNALFHLCQQYLDLTRRKS